MSIANGANFKICDALAVVSQGTVYSNYFLIRFGQQFGVWVLATSVSSTPVLKIELEESYTPPAIENAADTNYVVGEGVAPVFSNLNDELAHVKSLSPVPMQYGRYKITGLTSNPADSLVTIINFQQDLI